MVMDELSPTVVGDICIDVRGDESYEGEDIEKVKEELLK
jgi:hypothetical protein